MGLDAPETCRGWRNVLRISCASSWFYFTRLYRDAGSTKHKTNSLPQGFTGIVSCINIIYPRSKLVICLKSAKHEDVALSTPAVDQKSPPVRSEGFLLNFVLLVWPADSFCLLFALNKSPTRCNSMQSDLFHCKVTPHYELIYILMQLSIYLCTFSSTCFGLTRPSSGAMDVIISLHIQHMVSLV